MVDRDMLLADLVRLATKHKDYSGTVERDEQDGFRLRFFPKPDAVMIEERRAAWNEGVRALDSIAPRVIQFMNEYGIEAQTAETPGATLMAWVLQERFPANRVSASALTNAFDAVREALLRLDTRDFADRSLKQLHRHDQSEEHVRETELQARLGHRARLDKLKNVCRRLKEAIIANNVAFHQEVRAASATDHLAHVIAASVAVIDELGLGPKLDRNAQRKDKQLLSGQLDPTQIGYVKDELRLHLLLIKCRNITEQEITRLLPEIGLLSPSSCDDLWSDLWHYEQLVDVVEERCSKRMETGAPATGNDLPTSFGDSADSTDVTAEVPPVPFAGGNLVFYADRVELCDVDICSGRSGSKRIVLELLSSRKADGTFPAFSLDELQTAVSERGGKGTAAGLVRDLRNNIKKRLQVEANTICGHMDVILSRGRGYRLSEKLHVQFAGTDASNEDATNNICDSGVDDTNDTIASDEPDIVDDTDAPNATIHAGQCLATSVETSDNKSARREWIIKQLKQGVILKAVDVVNNFECDQSTAKRDLKSLKDEGTIEYIGSPRKGYYRLVQSTQSEK